MSTESLSSQARSPWRCSAIALLATLATVAIAAPASAGTPTGDFAPFSDCPLSTPGVNVCIFAQTTSGRFKIGNETVPITKTITLQGGNIVNEETFTEQFVPAADGNTLSRTPQTVPGGLLGIVAPELLPLFLQVVFNELINKGATGVTATAELVGPIGINTNNLVSATGTALTLPIRVHLSNPFLGPACYIGSSASPITLNLTTGTTSPPPPNTPIKGNVGELEIKDEGSLAVIKGNSLVDNAYSAPAAQGCGGLFSLLVDPVVDTKLGLPAAAGRNTAILNGKLEQAAAEAVKKSEK